MRSWFLNTAAVSSAALTVGDETAAVICCDREVTAVMRTDIHVKERHIIEFVLGFAVGYIIGILPSILG
jgi:thiamine monophosphate kinase